MMTKLKNTLKWLGTQPLSLLILAAFASLVVFRIPEFIDFLFGGATLTAVKAFVGIACLLAGVWIAKFARAATNNGETDALTQPQATIVHGVYIAVGIVVAAVILSL